MSRIWYTVVVMLFMIGLVGCDKPGPIELAQEDYPEPLEVSVFATHNQDTLVVSEYIHDLTGLAPNEEEKYPGTILVNGVKEDIAGYPYIYSYSRAVFVKKDSVIPVWGRFGQVFEHPRLDVGNVRVNGMVLEKKEVFTQIRSLTLIPVRTGVLYRMVNEGNAYLNPFVYRAGTRYSVEAEGRANVGSFTDAIESPEEITVVDPQPYALRFRDEDLVVRWKGKPGKQLNVLVSLYDEKNLRPGKPVMLLKSTVQSNGLKIPNKLIQLIPRTVSGKYLLTVVSANRVERRMQGFPGTVLVQAASIHNVGFTLK